MGSIIILFAVTLSVILLASFREIRQKNLDRREGGRKEERKEKKNERKR